MTIDEIKALIDDLVDTSTQTYPNDRKVRAINKAQDKIVNTIINNDGMNEFDDDGYSDLSEGFIDITSGVNDYSISEDENFAELLFVNTILIKDRSGEYKKIRRIKTSDKEFEVFLDGNSDENGEPIFYRITGKRIILSPKPDYSSTNGIKVLFVRKPKKVSITDTTRELSIPSTFHYLVALECAYDYARSKRMDNKNDLLNEINTEMAKLNLFIGNQPKDYKIRVIPRYRSAE